METLLTLSEVCKILSISTATGRNWVRLGKLVPQPASDYIKFRENVENNKVSRQLIVFITRRLSAGVTREPHAEERVLPHDGHHQSEYFCFIIMSKLTIP